MLVQVISAVSSCPGLRSGTNYFIVSLAAADLVMGALVMPFAMLNELGPRTWLFGRVWCDVWRAADVLSSTASILSLTGVAAERHEATTGAGSGRRWRGPRGRRCAVMVAAVWLLALCISFPAIVWWRLTDVSGINSGGCSCRFTSDAGYLIASSCVSFYCPLTIMAVLYARIYRTARATMRCLERGEKVIGGRNGSTSGGVLRLRIHRGGGGGGLAAATAAAVSAAAAAAGRDQPTNGGCRKNAVYRGIGAPLSGMVDICGAPVAVDRLRNVTQGLRRRRLNTLRTEHKAARTLGFVMGTFILCWLPFFICNILSALLPSTPASSHPLLFSPASLLPPITAWLGYANSAVNPLIYALSMRPFRLAFQRLLCPGRHRRHLINLSYSIPRP